MENEFNKSVVSDDIDSERYYQLEGFKDDELTDDDLSKNIDLSIGEVDRIMEQTVERSPLPGDSLQPYIGMEFKSRDSARDFYVAYGRHIGFTVRIHHNRRSRINNMVIGQDFVCSKEGFREKKYIHRKDRVLPPSPPTREGCSAMLRLALRPGDKWIVTKFIKEHSHSLLSPGKVPWRGAAKSSRNEDEKDQRIRELTLELHNERQRCKRRCAAYKEQLDMLLKLVEDHTDHLSRKVEDVVKNVKELEEAQLPGEDSSYSLPFR